VPVGLLAGGAVDPLAQEVGVTEVTRVLLDQVEVDPAQRVRVRLAEGVAELVRGHDLTDARAVLSESFSRSASAPAAVTASKSPSSFSSVQYS
jgi:hypothetical protein